MNRYVTAGLTVLAGAASFEAALIPGLVIGGAAMLAPRYLPKHLPKHLPGYLPKLRRGARPLLDAAAPRRPAASSRLGIKQAIAKTITFRIIVTTLDFTSNLPTRRPACQPSPWRSARCSIWPTRPPGIISVR